MSHHENHAQTGNPILLLFMFAGIAIVVGGAAIFAAIRAEIDKRAFNRNRRTP